MRPKIRSCVAKHYTEHFCFVDNSQNFKQLIEIIEAEGEKKLLNAPYHILQSLQGYFAVVSAVF